MKKDRTTFGPDEHRATPVDTIRQGAGDQVLLLHSSVAGARQWGKLMASLSGSFQVIAPNLIGYGTNPAWTADRPQTLQDQAVLARTTLADPSAPLHIVGHSFGASVAMQLAGWGGLNVTSLTLIEPTPFFLLQAAGQSKAYANAMTLRAVIKSAKTPQGWADAAAFFADYYTGKGTWAAMPQTRRAKFISALKPNFHEWDTDANSDQTLADFVSRLPEDTLVIHDPGTVPSILGLIELFRAATPWRIMSVAGGGHMAPLTRPDLINPVIIKELTGM